jgi:hypothetical protein
MTELRHGDGFVERWRSLSLAQQLGNVGSEVGRALKWRSRNPAIAQRALERALELIDLTLDDPRHGASVARLREICRVRETLLEFFLGTNRYGWTEAALMRYFDSFAVAAARGRGTG